MKNFVLEKKRKKRRRFLFAILLASLASSVFALIDPNFTPVQLVQQADAILVGEVLWDEGEGAIKILRQEVLKGEFKQESFQVLPTDQMIMEDLQSEVFASDVDKTAVLYVSRSRSEDGKITESAFMSFAHRWYSLSRDDEMWWMQQGGEGIDLVAVWEGRSDMLLACTRYILRAPEPSVPVKPGFLWAEPVKIGNVPVPEDYKPEDGVYVERILELPLSGRSGLAFLIISRAGDQVFFRPEKKPEFQNITDELKLESKSQAACLGDFNMDGRADLASWDGNMLRVFLQDEAGRFAAWAEELALETCLSLELIPQTGERRSGLLISTDTWPLLVGFSETGAMSAKALDSGHKNFPDEGLKQVYACLVADFDGDAMVDIMQPFRAGALYYKGRADGGFAAPARQENIDSGYGFTRSYICDFDCDGRLDIAFMGDAGFVVWGNKGEGRFDAFFQTGETDRFVNVGSRGAAVGDLNNDGRQDFVILYKRGEAQSFFNRGFSTFGLVRSSNLSAPQSADYSLAGQQAAFLRDCTGDGAQDLVMALNDGSVWMIPQETPELPLLAATVTLPRERWPKAPVRIVGRLQDGLLYGWNLTPGRSPALLSRPFPGPIEIEAWFPGTAKPKLFEALVEEECINFGLE